MEGWNKGGKDKMYEGGWKKKIKGMKKGGKEGMKKEEIK